jgi:hypothetical protein
MKKVRYAIGAAPLLGMMIPAAGAANAAAAVPPAQAPRVTAPHTDAGAAARLAAGHGKSAQYAVPFVNCGSNKIQGAFSANGHFHGAFNYSGVNCIHSQWASLNFAKTGLTERVRFYSGNGALERTTWQAGKIFHSPTYTFWTSVPNLNAHKVCEALVLNSNHTVVKYGPLCETV